MRKKSHISLAKHIVNISDMPGFEQHRKAFYVGSILPDCKPSFLTKRHEITGTIDLVERGMERLTKGYRDINELSTMYYTRLGEVLHYVADYFTYPHNKEYLGNMKEHCMYEGQLKYRLREYIKELNEKDIRIWKYDMKLSELEQFESVSDIMKYLQEEHNNYILWRHHCVEEDCKYIVAVCSKIAMAILHVCLKTMKCKKPYAVVR